MNETHSQLADLIGLIKSDGEINDQELDFLFKVAQQMGVSREDLDKLFKSKTDFTPPKNEFERIVQFYRLVLLMNVDNDKNVQELNYVRNLAIRMGLNPISTNKILELMDNYPDKKVPVDVLISVFQQNHN